MKERQTQRLNSFTQTNDLNLGVVLGDFYTKLTKHNS